MTWQVREYTVRPGEMQAWLDEWRAKIVPLRQKFGFHVLGVWTVDGTDEFIWVITYRGPKAWQEADAEYYGSAERKSIQPDPARHLARQASRLMSEVSLEKLG